MNYRSADGDVRADSAVRAPIIAAYFIFLLGSFPFLRAAAPSLDGFYPAGGERGLTNIAVGAAGKFDSWPPKVWMDGAGVVFTAETNKGKFSVSISPDAAPGPRLVRLYNDDGASELRFFVVGSGKEIAEAESNNHFAKAQRVSELPVTINGRLDKNGDVDSFALHLRAGEWFEARADSYALLSKLDAALRLMNTNGQQIAWNHDFITLDPRLSWRASNDTTIVLQIFGWAYPPGSEIGFTGGEAVVYRLHLAVMNRLSELCASPTESEPNDTARNARPVELPAQTNGTIQSATDEDRFSFAAAKNEIVEARIEAASFGSPLDAWLAIEDSTGRQLARSDDADGSRDPKLEWKVPTNGNFIVAIGSVTHRGAEDFCYHLSLQKVRPDYTATLGENSIVLTSGATNELKIDVKRLRGFTNELMIDLRNLPAGVAVLTTNLQPQEKATTIKLSAAVDAPKFQGAVRLFLIDSETKLERVVPFELITRGETGFNHLLMDSADALWMTVRPKPATDQKETAKKEP